MTSAITVKSYCCIIIKLDKCSEQLNQWFIFYFCFIAVVPENVPVGISVVNITATDPDEGLGGELKYDFLDEGEANGKINIRIL